MRLQNKQLDSMSKWLQAMEDVINSAQPIGTDPDVVKRQTLEHEVCMLLKIGWVGQGWIRGSVSTCHCFI